MIPNEIRFIKQNYTLNYLSIFIASGRRKTIEVSESRKELHGNRRVDARNSQQFHRKDLYRRNREIRR